MMSQENEDAVLTERETDVRKDQVPTRGGSEHLIMMMMMIMMIKAQQRIE